jgi:hypothetical protein
VLNPPDPALELREPDRGELQIVGTHPEDARISRHVRPILAALRIDDADLTILKASEETGDALTLANLTKLYRAVVLAEPCLSPSRTSLRSKHWSGRMSGPIRSGPVSPLRQWSSWKRSACYSEPLSPLPI